MPDSKIIPLIDLNKNQALNLDSFPPTFRICQQLFERHPEGFTLESQLPKINEYHNKNRTCCTQIIGQVRIPVGVVGPVTIDTQEYYVSMATAEGGLVTGSTRGCRATQLGGGIQTRIISDGKEIGTQCPVIRFKSAVAAADALIWLEEAQHYSEVKEAFESGSQLGKLKSARAKVAGRYLLIQFEAKPYDVTGTEMALKMMQTKFPQMEIMDIGGNNCTHKKLAASDRIAKCKNNVGVVAEAIIPAAAVAKVLETNVATLVGYNNTRNFVMTATNGSTGEFNSLSAKIVSAIFIATGQDPAQTVSNSSCMILMEPCGENGKDLFISCTMPSINVGTVDELAGLPAQNSCLQMLGLSDPHPGLSDKSAETLARIICGAVLAGELSLRSTLAGEHTQI